MNIKQNAVSPLFYHTSVDQKRARKATLLYVSAAQRKSIIRDLGDACFIVFDYYMEKAGVKGFNYDDALVAKALGYTERKVQYIRQKLMRNGWVKQLTYKHSTGQKLIVTLLGKDVVSNHEKEVEIFKQIKSDFIGSTETHLR